MKSSLTIQIVTWNSAGDLPPALEALQSIPDDVVVRVIDNNSSDNSLDIIQQALPHADIVRNKKNLGFGPAHNQGIALCDTEFILLHNPDLVLEWGAMNHFLSLFADDRVGAVQGKLLRTKPKPGTIPKFDTTGIILTKALNGRERAAGEEDRGQYDTPGTILAPSGAAGLYRISALHDVAHRTEHGEEFFDHDFFAYKEDVDLGWRLNRAGWKVLYDPTVLGYHSRALKREGLFNWGLNPVKIYQRLRSPRTAYSLRNWFWLMLKNVSPKQLLLHTPHVLAREVVMLLLSILYPPLLRAWWQALIGTPKMLAKRSQHSSK